MNALISMFKDLTWEKRLNSMFAVVIVYMGGAYILWGFLIANGQVVNSNFLVGLSITSICFALNDFLTTLSNNYLLLSEESAQRKLNGLQYQYKCRYKSTKLIALILAVLGICILLLAHFGIKFPLSKSISDATAVLGIGIPFIVIGLKRFYDMRTEYRKFLFKKLDKESKRKGINKGKMKRKTR